MVATKSRLEKLDMESGYVGSRLGCKLITGNRATCFSETEPAMKQCKGAKEDESERLRLARLNRRINESLEPVMGTVLLGCKVWWMRMRVGSLIRWWGECEPCGENGRTLSVAQWGLRLREVRLGRPLLTTLGEPVRAHSGIRALEPRAPAFGGGCSGKITTATARSELLSKVPLVSSYWESPLTWG